ncbi:helix-turn-helix domain-containing protein [Enterococcus hirae]|uniref:helix-turn-helix domain-containing protein n=1 Tax=Enterococcus TaxID=1350 RepID=UPI0015C44C5B|nr:helix-turn-helix domain-containing protein [Enterococcus hirae]EMF0041874.1 helix-turn-helix domain-containing protein [Enterococcus hirae]EMF0126049.1 helix-turn-helix domain-containing protein [Enterococcus hirae]EMF0136613.1 helix-turn-helix domain-containing protein [Enterococcus hirae]EMF0162341.1 helix-turn-helix domain-containing protein [Enterococcus hirae]
MENNVIGTQISLLRKKFGLTQEDLANKLGFSKQTISNWETGLKTPRMGAIQKIADLFNVSKSFIIEGVEEAPSASIEKIYNQLSPPRQQKVYNFAKQELKEQQEQNKAVIPIEKEEKNSDEIYTLAAHSDDPDKTYTDEEISEIEAFLDKVKADYDKKHNK